MIELRWLELDRPVGHIRQNVLQYRIMTNIEEIGIQPPIWSDWIDVPTVSPSPNPVRK